MTLHRLKRSEEGQALVLAAIFALVLTVCVLGTVNLGRTVYDKIQLQAAADSAAYSQAAVEARVLNFTAYTNRAMVVHYASLMAATSYLAYIHFEWPLLKALCEVLGKLPYVGPAFAAMEQVVGAVISFLDAAVFALAPLLSAANIALYAIQEGVWWSAYARLGHPLPPEAHSGDSAERPYQPIWPALIPLANQAVFAQTRGHATLPEDTAETARILVNAKSDVVQQARLHMLEIANSARQPWVAYGDGSPAASGSPAARHFRWTLLPGHLWYGNRARTEMGSAPPGGTGDAQIWSGQQNSLSYDFSVAGVHFAGTTPFFTFVATDQLAPFTRSYFAGFGAGRALGTALFWLFPALEALDQAVTRYAGLTRPDPALDARVFALSPYVYFAPRASNTPGLGPLGALGNFAQPDVLVGLAKEGRDLNAEPGLGRRFSWDGKAAAFSATDFSYGDADWPRLSGLPRNLQLLHKGLNAFAAAQVYYHRPGDWKEQPNFFNPLWGARLIPVLQSNAAAKLGLTSTPLLDKLLLH